MGLKVYQPSDKIAFPTAIYYGTQLLEIYKYQPDYIENAIKKYKDFAIDIQSFEKLPKPTPVQNRLGYESNFIKLNEEKGVAIEAQMEADDLARHQERIKQYWYMKKLVEEHNEDAGEDYPIEKPPTYPKLIRRKKKELEWPEGNDLLKLVNEFALKFGYKPKEVEYKFPADVKVANEAKIKAAKR